MSVCLSVLGTRSRMPSYAEQRAAAQATMAAKAAQAAQAVVPAKAVEPAKAAKAVVPAKAVEAAKAAQAEYLVAPDVTAPKESQPKESQTKKRKSDTQLEKRRAKRGLQGNATSQPEPAPLLEPSCRAVAGACLLYTSPSPRDGLLSRMPSSA